jgi:triosephosphate isomerase
VRKKILAGNWKMNGSFDSAKQLASEIVSMSKNEIRNDVQLILFPPIVFLQSIVQLAKGSSAKTGAQNCSWQNEGALTGEVSAAMIKSIGADYVIIGHSERRTFFKEDDEMLKKKTGMALESNLVPVFCCGETLNERNEKKHFVIVKSQLENSLFHLEESKFSNVIIAYEPVWAIGTGLTATPAQAQEMHAYIRTLIRENYGANRAGDTSILYGGSCNEQNAKELFALPDVDGGLIGGASLKSGSFINIAKSF